jgi:bifunctional non-homologous end joining protein LigD
MPPFEEILCRGRFRHPGRYGSAPVFSSVCTRTPEGSRKYFGALLVGFYEGKKLKFAGRVGTGFGERLLSSLFSDLNKIRVDKCPFYNLPAAGRNRWDQGLSIAEMKRCRWVKPVMVCQIKFTEWTRDDRLRQPVFLGIREDKNANEVVREKAS